MEKEKSKAPAVTATIKIIEYIATCRTAVGLSEISAATGINTNMISRALAELIASDWVYLDDQTGKYSLTLQLFKIGSTALEKKNLLSCAMPYLKRLNDITGECIQLAVLNDDRAVYIAQMDSKNVAGVRGQIGASYSLDNTAPGKALKAFVKKDTALEDIRKRGYAIDKEEYSRGIICIAAPIYDYTDEVVAAVGISSLTVNHTLEEMIEKYSGILLEETGKLSRELGYKKF